MAVYGSLPHVPLPVLPGLLHDSPAWGPAAVAWHVFANSWGLGLLFVSAVLLILQACSRREKQHRFLQASLPLSLLLAWACLLFPLGRWAWLQHLGETPELVPDYGWAFAISLIVAMPTGLLHAFLALKNPAQWAPAWLLRFFALGVVLAAVVAGLYVGLGVQEYSQAQALRDLNTEWGCTGPPDPPNGALIFTDLLNWMANRVLVWVLPAALLLFLPLLFPHQGPAMLRMERTLGTYAAWSAWLTAALMFLGAIGLFPIPGDPNSTPSLFSYGLLFAAFVSALHLRTLSPSARPGWTISLLSVAVAAVVLVRILSTPLEIQAPFPAHGPILTLLLDAITRPPLPPETWRLPFKE